MNPETNAVIMLKEENISLVKLDEMYVFIAPYLLSYVKLISDFNTSNKTGLSITDLVAEARQDNKLRIQNLIQSALQRSLLNSEKECQNSEC